MNHVEHIPQTLASHSGSYLWEAQQDEHGADMLKADPRDTFFLSKWDCTLTQSLRGFGGGEEARSGCHRHPERLPCLLHMSWVVVSLLGSVWGAAWATNYHMD